MSGTTATALAVIAVVLAGLALYAMAAGQLALAGTSFMSASIVIYIRETRVLTDDE